ncbi:eukaryotic translation initiation factor 1-like [Halichondria panicea]|uniref:eukaryotic translation initiation factor 1-like n=1 Tax=Halichondria panicea TaxID=6063 RepID=UPI00312BB096
MMSKGKGVINLEPSAADPFQDTSDSGGSSLGKGQGAIHIRIQQRNGRKTLTTVQGIAEAYDKRRIAKACKKEFACNGTVVDHPEYGEVIQLQGDQRHHISEFLVEVGLATKEQIKMHGF